MDKQNKFQPLDDEEKELMASIESDTWEPVSNFDEEKQKAIEAARRTLEKDNTLTCVFLKKIITRYKYVLCKKACRIKHLSQASFTNISMERLFPKNK